MCKEDDVTEETFEVDDMQNAFEAARLTIGGVHFYPTFHSWLQSYAQNALGSEPLGAKPDSPGLLLEQVLAERTALEVLNEGG